MWCFLCTIITLLATGLLFQIAEELSILPDAHSELSLTVCCLRAHFRTSLSQQWTLQYIFSFLIFKKIVQHASFCLVFAFPIRFAELKYELVCDVFVFARAYIALYRTSAKWDARKSAYCNWSTLVSEISEFSIFSASMLLFSRNLNGREIGVWMQVLLPKRNAGTFLKVMKKTSYSPFVWPSGC